MTSPRPLQVAIGVGAVTDATARFVVEAERIGASSVWVPEAWGYDALTPLGFLAARTTSLRLASGIAQLGTRTPAMLAMSAMSLAALSGGRFLLGLGVSGPQIMEGWHGTRFGSSLAVTRETIEIVRMVAGGERLDHQGSAFQVPLPGGAGRPIRSMAAPVRVPIYLAALGPKNLALTGELADGWLGNAFMPETASAFLDPLAAGAARSGRRLEELDLVIPVALEITDDVEEAAARHSAGYAFTIGAMGSETQNFYNAAFTRQGYGDDVVAVQGLWRDGKRAEAAARVPRQIGFRTNLLGPADLIRDRLRLYQSAGVTTLQVKPAGVDHDALDALGLLIDLVREAEPGRGGEPLDRNPQPATPRPSHPATPPPPRPAAPPAPAPPRRPAGPPAPAPTQRPAGARGGARVHVRLGGRS